MFPEEDSALRKALDWLWWRTPWCRLHGDRSLCAELCDAEIFCSLWFQSSDGEINTVRYFCFWQRLTQRWGLEMRRGFFRRTTVALRVKNMTFQNILHSTITQNHILYNILENKHHKKNSLSTTVRNLIFTFTTTNTLQQIMKNFKIRATKGNFSTFH